MTALRKGVAGTTVAWVTRGYVKYRWRRLWRDAATPWREGRDGTAAAVGRWIGVSLAVGAKAVGVGAAFYVVMKKR